ncbi:hypothetical protein ACYPKM_02135 [Pseudomonas aeruginosa]
MDIATFTAILEPCTQDQMDALEDAHWRYMNLQGIIQDDDMRATTEADRAAFPHLWKPRADHALVYVHTDCIEFMHKVTSLSERICEAFICQDFYDTHGITVEEAGQRGTV